MSLPVEVKLIELLSFTVILSFIEFQYSQLKYLLYLCTELFSITKVVQI